ncbi:MAG: lysyl oxidase family protein, partial [Actinomycetota bacterium]
AGQSARQAYQRIYYDSNNTNAYERKKDRVSRDIDVGCMTFHEAHNHWHFDHFARYELYDCVIPLGATLCSRNGSLRSGEKVTFCIADVFRRSTTTDSPTSSRYGFGCGRQAAQGLSVGWGDQYTRSTSGQELSISGLLATTYCYVSTADPNNLLIERSEGDNSQSIRLTLSDTDGDTLLDTVVKGTAGC